MELIIKMKDSEYQAYRNYVKDKSQILVNLSLLQNEVVVNRENKPTYTHQEVLQILNEFKIITEEILLEGSKYDKVK